MKRFESRQALIEVINYRAVIPWRDFPTAEMSDGVLVEKSCRVEWVHWDAKSITSKGKHVLSSVFRGMTKEDYGTGNGEVLSSNIDSGSGLYSFPFGAAATTYSLACISRDCISNSNTIREFLFRYASSSVSSSPSNMLISSAYSGVLAFVGVAVSCTGTRTLARPRRKLMLLYC